ncbi:MAG: methyltransferase domain-containing protein [Nitrosomonas sp.]|nr:methyltransferase domain-containing protein [Nitrosomonas sp.]
MAISLHEQRLDAVVQQLLASGATSVLDLGCGTGELLLRLVAHHQFSNIVGIDIDEAVLMEARQMLGIGLFDPTGRVTIRHGSFEQTSTDLTGFAAAALVETIEHIDPHRLTRVEHAIFGYMQPVLVLVTTPNQDYNPLHGLASHQYRHPDHRFEWSRKKFREWSQGVAARNGYQVTFNDIGPYDTVYGSSTQMARFERD